MALVLLDLNKYILFGKYSKCMTFYLLISQIDQLNVIEKMLWSVAIVTTLLLIILEVMSFLGLDLDNDRHPRRSRHADARTVLLFFVFFGWTSILAHLWISELPAVFLIGIPVGLFTALLPRAISVLNKKNRQILHDTFELNEALKSTGEVLAFIPSGRGGTGKVHLNLRSAPYQIDAVSNGHDLPVGSPVRVVEIVEGRLLVVEPLDAASGAPPHEPPPSDGF